MVKIKDQPNNADFVGTNVHEYAHTLLHIDEADDSERAKRGVGAKAVA